MLSHHVIIIPVYIDVKSPWSNLFVYPFEIYPIKSLRLSDTLWLFNSLPWYRWPIEIDGLPIKNMVIFHGELLVITRWYIQREILSENPGSLPRPSLGGLPHLEVLILSLDREGLAGDGGDGGWPKWVSSKKPRDLTKIFKHYQLNIFWYPRFLFLRISGVLVKVFPWVFAIFMPVLKLIGVLDVVPTLVRFHGATKCREMPIPEVSQPTAWQPGKSQVLHAHQATGPGLQRVCTLDTLALEVRRNHLPQIIWWSWHDPSEWPQRSTPRTSSLSTFEVKHVRLVNDSHIHLTCYWGNLHLRWFFKDEHFPLEFQRKYVNSVTNASNILSIKIPWYPCFNGNFRILKWRYCTI